MSTLGQDARYALRGIARNPGFAAVAILTIGIGIGANTTVYGWMHALLLDPIPGAQDSRALIAVENTAANGDPLTTSWLDYRDYRNYAQSFETLVALTPITLAVGDTRTQPVWGEMVTPNYFDLMRVKPAIGRFFEGDERSDEQNAHPVVVINHSFWKSHFNENPAAIGSTIRINRTPFTVIGVAPASFHGSQTGLEFQMWLPASMYGEVTHTGTWMLRDRNTRIFAMLARLKPGVPIPQARAEMKALAERMAVANTFTNTGVGADVLPMWKGHFTAQAIVLGPIAILMCAAALLLLIVCANVANLLLARATGRRAEFTIRLALGASKSRLALQLLTETLVLALGGAAAGLAIASWLSNSLRWLAPKVSSPALVHHEMPLGVLLFTTGAAVLVAVLAGAGPALAAARANVAESLKEAGRSAAAGRSHGLRTLLVVGEVALAVVGIVGAGLFLKSFRQAREMNPGFEPKGIAMARFDLGSAGYKVHEARAFCQRLREALARQPGVVAVSFDDAPPLGFGGMPWEPVQVEGYVPARNENMKIDRDLVAPGYFSLMKIPLVAGRDFDDGDWAEKLIGDARQKVLIVNQEFARRFFGDRDPIGRKVQGWGQWFTIVGVAGNIKYRQLTESPRPYIYAPMYQVYRPEFGLTVSVRTAGPVPDALATIRREAAAIDPALTVFDSKSMTEHMAGSLYGQRVGAVLLNVLGALGLLMAALGLYGVMAYSVAQRTAEIGIRVTLGAAPGGLMVMVLRQGVQLAAAGLAAGFFVAAALARMLGSALAGVSPVDPVVYLGAAGFVVGVALLASAMPAWRALRVDPMVALRCQ